MRVLFLPFFRKNPYQKLLKAALERQGVGVFAGARHRFFSLWLSLRSHGKPEVIHLHWQHPFLLASTRFRTLVKSGLFVLEVLLVKAAGVKLVWTVHNLHAHEKIFHRIELFFGKILARLSNRLMVHSQGAVGTVTAAFGPKNAAKISVIPHASFIGYYRSRLNRDQARQRLKIEPDRLVFLGFGIIRAYKGVEHLIETFKKWAHPGALLLLVGTFYTEEMARTIRGQAKNCGNIKIVSQYVADDDLHIYFNAADAVVLPYEHILASSVAVLAMSFARPVVAPALKFMQEIVGEGDNFLFDPRQPQGLLEALKRVDGCRAELARRGRRNYARIKPVTWEAMARQTAEVYRGVQDE
jgi:glycosyltransferase involved in cell wall biosynthesis